MSEVIGFNDFVNESKVKQLGGVVILWEDKILLVHPTNSSWQKSALGIPKGGLNDGEEPIEGAVRELEEETGIKLSSSDLEPEGYSANKIENGKVISQMTYYIKRIDDPSEIGMDGHKIAKDQLQLEEIDWAGFVKITDAYHKIHQPQLIILDRVR